MERILPEFDLVLEKRGGGAVPRESSVTGCDQFLRRGSRSFPEGGALAPERQVAARYGIGRGTVHKAYEQLAAEGLLRRRENGRCYLVCSAGEEGFPCIGIILPRRFEEYYAPESISGPMSQGYYNGFTGRRDGADSPQCRFSHRLRRLPATWCNAGSTRSCRGWPAFFTSATADSKRIRFWS